MTASAAEIALALGGTKSGDEYKVRCVAHQERTASLCLSDKDGKLLYYCHAGCTQEQVQGALERQGFDVRGKRGDKAKISLADFAIAKGLPMQFLTDCGVTDHAIDRTGRYGTYQQHVIRFEYRNDNGEKSGVKYRGALSGAERGFTWEKGGKVILYGLWRPFDPKAPLVLCEGESDCLTLWLHGYQALGLPGAKFWKKTNDLPKKGTIYVVIEYGTSGKPDKGGEAILKSIAESPAPLRERMRIVHMSADAKDPNALYLRDRENFKLAFQNLLDTAEPAIRAEQTEAEADLPTEGLPTKLSEFYAYMPMHQYIFKPTGMLWPGSSVNASCEKPTETKQVPRKRKGGELEWEEIPLSPTEWLDTNQHVEQMTWVPGEPELIRNRLVSEGGWFKRQGSAVFNLYRPPQVQPGSPRDVTPWLRHLLRVYSKSDAKHILRWLAHRVQKPGEKINHALFLGGVPGIGKDSILEPVKYAVGSWNFCDVGPKHFDASFNGFVKSVILRVNEVHDLGEVDRYGFYEHLKTYTAAPPDVLRCNEKHLREHAVPNVCGVILTSNHKTDGIYLPVDDRRTHVSWSERRMEDFNEAYFDKLHKWYESGGKQNVAAYLAQVDLRSFNPKAPPPKTAAFYEIVDANRAPEDAELADALDQLKYPDAVTKAQIERHASPQFQEWLRDRKNRRQIPHRMESVGYAPIRNDAAKDGLWKIEEQRQVIYAKRELSVRDRLAAATKLAKEPSQW